MKQHYDVLIIGGGIVGLTLACALAKSRLQVAVIEAHELSEINKNDDYDLRVSAISRASQQVFSNLNAWQGMCSRRVSPYQAMHVWDATGDGLIDFDAADLGVDVLGHIIENQVIQLALIEQLKKLPNVDWLCPLAVNDIQYAESGSLIKLDDGRELTADLLVGADGANSRVREAAGIDIEKAAYHQKGIVCVVKSSKHHKETAWQRFLPTGPVAFLPLADGRCSIVWSVTDEEADRLVLLDEDSFCKELEQAFDYTLGQIESVGPRAAFPLIRRHAQSYIKPGLALIGDAAPTIHPPAGQGAHLGIPCPARSAQGLLYS